MSPATLRHKALLAAVRLRAATSEHTLTGYIDGTKFDRVIGWAYDTKDPKKRVTVDLYCGGKLISSAVAGQYRADLKAAEIGDGRYGFACEFPGITTCTTKTVSVRVRSTPLLLELNHAEVFDVELTPAPFITYVAIDTVNNCNLRCPFCLVDYSKVTHTELMSEETFERLLTLIDYVDDWGFWMSCLHEPTLHPKFNRLLDMVPRTRRKDVLFTTNLARPLDEATFAGWADSGIDHINISLDSMKPELFAVLRKFGRYEVFQQNLDRMASVFRQFPNPPKLRYITMAFKSNFDEITDIIRVSHERWLSYENEIRYTYNFQHIPDEFRNTHYLDKEDWAVLDERLAKLPYNHYVGPPPDEYEEKLQQTIDYDALKLVNLSTRRKIPRPLQLRARPDGKVFAIGHEDVCAVDIRSLEDPPKFFRELLS